MNVEVRQTKDGSTTLFVPELNEHYHSVHGALQESLHVFIEAGLVPLMVQGQKDLRVLEIGFGTGLNALLTLQQSLMHPTTQLYYETLEKYPVPAEIIQQMHFGSFILNPELLDYFDHLHQAPWDIASTITPHFTLQKLQADLLTHLFPLSAYHLIYFDAFAPEKQPDLWAEEVFARLFAALQRGGVLVSYCAKGSFKRALKAAGFTVEALPGPPGKREMTRARKEGFV